MYWSCQRFTGKELIVVMKGINTLTHSVLKLGPAWWVDPGMESVRVKAKTRLGFGPGKPSGSTRDPVHPAKPG